jgi:hypothetical protein
MVSICVCILAANSPIFMAIPCSFDHAGLPS